MAAFIKTLQDASRENIIYPRTKSEAVYRDDNTTSVEDTLVNLESEVASIIENTNNISGVYETKEDASAKLEEAKTYTDEQIAGHVHSWNDLEDKPFGETESWTLITSLEFEGTYANLNLLDTSVKNIKFVFDGEEYFFDFYGDGTYGGDGYPFEFSAEFSGFAIGYVLYITCDDGFHTVEIYEGKTTVKTIDAKYLPDSVKAQPDWNQNDPEAPDYVKNRTHYTTAEYIEEFNGEVTCLLDNEFNRIDTIMLQENTTYKVTFYGTEYVLETVPTDKAAYTNFGGLQLGNLIDYPFRIVSGLDMINYEELRVIDVNEGYEGTFALAIAKLNETVHTLDEKFLPESVKAQPDWEQNVYGQPGYILNRPGGYYDSDGDAVKFSERFLPSDILQMKSKAYEPPFGGSDISGMIYSNGKFMAFRNVTWMTSAFISSTDGFNWTNEAEIPIDVHHIACGDDGRIVAVQQNGGTGAYSDDGIVWTEMSMPDDSLLGDIVYGNGTYVVLYGGGRVLYSKDGITWSECDLPNNVAGLRLTFGAGKFIALPNNYKSVIFHSEDGISWTQESLPCQVAYPSIAYGDGRFVVVDQVTKCVLYSDNGTSWTQVSEDGLLGWELIAYGAGKFVAYYSGAFYYSSDGIFWTEATIDTEESFYARGIVYGAGMFIAHGWNEIAISYDGVNWFTEYDALINIEDEDVANRVRELIHVQPDWNQNDETAPDYVKNRPFGYYDIQWTLGEGVVNDEWGQKVENVVINDFAIQEDGMYKATTTNLDYTFYSWEDVYKIVIDGISYIGKGSHEEFDTGGDTGSVIISSSFICEQPFIKIYNHRNGFQITTELSGDTHTLSIYVGTSIPKKVPDDFLPESALVTSLDWEQRDPKALDYIKNKPYGYFTRNRYFKEIPHFRLPKGTLIVKSRAIEIEEGLPYYGLNKVFFLNNKFIGVGMDRSYASIVFSDDGLNWYNKTDLPSAMSKYSTHSQLLIYGNNTYLTAQEYKTALASSTDEGASWTVIDSPATDYIKSLFFANNKFFVATETELYASENLINWELIYTKEEEEEGIIQQATYIKNKILIIFNKKIISLTDGENNWKEIDLPIDAGWLGPVLLDNENRLFLFSDFSNTSVYSDDNGDTWDYLTDFDFFDRGSFSSYDSCKDYASDGNSLVFVTNSNIWKTNDGHDFEYGYADLGEIPTLEWITYGNGIFLAGFENGVIYSEDGTTWITSPEVVITTPDTYYTPDKLANYLVSQEMVKDMIEEAIGAAIGGSY